MTVRISNAVAIAGLDTMADQVDGGPAAGVIEFRTGAAPTNVEDIDSGTLLATLTGSDPFFLGATDGTGQAEAAADTITSDTDIDASGTPAHFRMKTSTGTACIQGSVGTSGADINFDSTTWVAGGTAAITSLNLVLPELAA